MKCRRLWRVRQKEPWSRFAAKALCCAVVIVLASRYLADRFQVGIDFQLSQCLPGARVFIVDRQDVSVEKGDLVAFRAARLAPFIKDGEELIKIAAALPGDTVSVGPGETSVNGTVVGEGLDLAEIIGRPDESFTRQVAVQPGTFWMMGRTRDSYDSRYWGPIDTSQVIGKAYVLF
jgi:conjugal transfer pilin signal peptidase TrbI